MVENQAKNAKHNDDDSSDEEEDIPWACFICRKPYTDPSRSSFSHNITSLQYSRSTNLVVVTRCSHYFCSTCAIKRFTKTPKCAACGTPTGGIFNRADKIVEKMRAKKAAEEAAGEDEEEGQANKIEVEGLSGDSDSD